MIATPLLTVIILGVLLEIGVRLVVDDGTNLDLEMWKYAHRIKQRSANPLIGHEHRPYAHAHLMGVDVATNSLSPAAESTLKPAREAGVDPGTVSTGAPIHRASHVVVMPL